MKAEVGVRLLGVRLVQVYIRLEDGTIYVQDEQAGIFNTVRGALNFIESHPVLSKLNKVYTKPEIEE